MKIRLKTVNNMKSGSDQAIVETPNNGIEKRTPVVPANAKARKDVKNLKFNNPAQYIIKPKIIAFRIRATGRGSATKTRPILAKKNG